VGFVALADHRDTFFRSLRNIQQDDTIDLETENGAYRYVVESTKIVGPRDVSVLAAGKKQTLTLVTCYPFYYVGSAPKRFIVRAVQVAHDASITPRQPRQGS
jgi:sortase A